MTTLVTDHKTEVSFSVEEILSTIPATRVTVFGDFCLDAYWWMDDSEGEKSLETGLPARRVNRHDYSLGGAGNVVANLIALGVMRVRAIGAVGKDLFGNELLRQLRQRGVDITGMLQLGDDWQTMVYAKPCEGPIELNRMDFGNCNSFNEEHVSQLIAKLDKAAADSDVVVLNQQRPSGINTREVIREINRIIRVHPRTHFIVDARHHAALFDGTTLKLNVDEARRRLDEHSDDFRVTSTQACEYARRLWQQTHQPVFLTRGDKGIVVADHEVVHEIPGIQIIDRTDPVGAGDTTVAALAAVLGSGGDPLSAARFANLAASITTRKIQTTGTVTPDEIRHFADADYIYSPDLAQDLRHAKFQEGTEIEIVESLPDRLSIKHAIFDHDGTISTLRQGWEEIMAPMMIREILGSYFESAAPSLFQRVKETVHEFIDKTTGVQTLVQMQGLAQMVRRFALVPADQVLDEHGYKRIFNEQLLAMVNRRVQKLERGELDPADFEIKNVRRLLTHLHNRGVKLYLASGTDEIDVCAEAEAMRYAHLFEGRIFGAVGDVKLEAKKIVLERIIRDHNLSGGDFVTFGDGPVEIRETRKRGGICIGVASDEVRRFGLNQSKRTRLIRAGAHLIIPDFSQLSSLLALLQLA